LTDALCCPTLYGAFRSKILEFCIVRYLSTLDNLVCDFRYALRNLRKDRRFTIVAVFALALGIGASTVVFSVFYNLLFNAFAAKDAGRLVVPVVRDANSPDVTWGLYVNWADLEYLREHNQIFDDLVGSYGGISLVKNGGQGFQVDNGRVTANAFEFYGVAPLFGRGIVSADGESGASPVFVMSYRLWKGEFGGDTRILGKSFVIDDRPRTLVGVMPKRFRGFGMKREIWMPVSWKPTAADLEYVQKFEVLARLKRGVTLAAASAEMDITLKRLAALHPEDDDYPKRSTGEVLYANDFLLSRTGTGTVFNSQIQLKSLLYDLLVAVLVLLLIACSNVANLMLARATAREKETAVRAALGASRGKLIGQLLMESLVLALAACAAGSALAWAATRVVESIVHQKAWEKLTGEAVVGLNLPVLMFAVGITVLTALLCGVVPALRATKRDLQAQLVGSGKGGDAGFQHGRFRAALVIVQVALSIVLLIGAGLTMRSFYQLTHIDLGFNPRNILVAAIAPARTGDRLPDRALMASAQGQILFQQVVDQIQEVPGVESVTLNNAIPGYGPSGGPRVGVPGDTRDVEAGLNETDEKSLDTLEMRLIAGRWLSRADVQTRQYEAVVNERLAHTLFGESNPVGRRFEVRGFRSRFKNAKSNLPETALFEIVGVVGDTKNAGPQAPVVPMAFIPPMIGGGFLMQVRTKADPASLMHAIQRKVWRAEPNEVFWLFGPLTDFLQQYTYASPEFGATLSGPLAGIALLLVVVGVFSVMAYTVSLRTREIGVRMALGAQRGEILRMVLRKGSVLIVAGICIGLFASYALTRFLASQIWGVSATDPWTFGAVVALVVGVGLAACYLPARRATQVDPLVALRYE
jgi:putative ABC transport system permease protein